MTMDEVWTRLRFTLAAVFLENKEWRRNEPNVGEREKVLAADKQQTRIHVGSWSKLIQVSFEAIGNLCPAHLAGRNVWSRRRRPKAHFLQQHTPHLEAAKKRTSAKASTTWRFLRGGKTLVEDLSIWLLCKIWLLWSPILVLSYPFSTFRCTPFAQQIRRLAPQDPRHGGLDVHQIKFRKLKGKWIWDDHGYYMLLHIIKSTREGQPMLAVSASLRQPRQHVRICQTSTSDWAIEL